MQTNCSLQHLTDKELIDYYHLFLIAHKKSVRFMDRKVNLYDTKNAYNLLRLILQCEQIVINQDLELDKDAELYKSIRRGEWKLEDIKQVFFEKEKILEQKILESDLPNKPDHGKIKALLLNALEIHYGSLREYVRDTAQDTILLNEVRKLLCY